MTNWEFYRVILFHLAADSSSFGVPEYSSIFVIANETQLMPLNATVTDKSRSKFE